MTRGECPCCTITTPWGDCRCPPGCPELSHPTNHGWVHSAELNDHRARIRALEKALRHVIVRRHVNSTKCAACRAVLRVLREVRRKP